MAKPLTKPQATSSVAAMLQRGVGAQALARPEQRPSPVLPTPIIPQTPGPIAVFPKERPTLPSDPPDTLRQFALTSKLDRVLKKVVSIYSEATELDLKHSEVIRAILMAFDHAMPELTREASSIGTLRRPKNDRGNELIRDQMERKIARAIIAGMRAAAAFE